MVAALGDLTSGPVRPRLRDRMLESPEGRQILKERPRINSHTVDMNKLALLPAGTFGHAYVTWLERCGVTPDTREPVCFPSLNYGFNRPCAATHATAELAPSPPTCLLSTQHDEGYLRLPLCISHRVPYMIGLSAWILHGLLLRAQL